MSEHFPRSFGDYTIQSFIDQGGMCNVYRATAPNHNLVALKILKVQFVDDAMIRNMLHAEKDLYKRHPNIVRAFDAGEAFDPDHNQTLPYIAQQLIDGQSLNKYLQQHSTLKPDKLANILTDVAQALDATHRAGIIHLDIKPGNILLDKPMSRAYLTDFSIAYKQRHDMTITRAQLEGGTYKYMAPEQLDPDKYGKLSPATDVYSLGITAFVALTGRAPFISKAGDELEGALLRLKINPPAVRDVNAAISKEISEVVLKAMQREPARRYKSAGEFAHVFRRALRQSHAVNPKLVLAVASFVFISAVIAGVSVGVARSNLNISIPVAKPIANLGLNTQVASNNTPAGSRSVLNEIAQPVSSPTRNQPGATSTVDVLRPTATLASNQAIRTATVRPGMPVAPARISPTAAPAAITPSITPARPAPAAISIDASASYVGYERWGKPMGADSCSGFDNSRAVSRARVTLVVVNEGAADLTNWYVLLADLDGNRTTACPEGPTPIIRSGSSANISVLAFLPGETIGRATVVGPGVFATVCFAGHAGASTGAC